MIKYALLPLKLQMEGIAQESDFFVPEALKEGDFIGAHHPEYVQRVFRHSLGKDEIRRIGFPWSESLVYREALLCGGTYQCAKYAASNKGVSLNVAGGTHHAGRIHGEGFCIFNDVAVAIRLLQKEKEGCKYLVIDLDVHQGNGTAEIFEDDANVFTFSMHAQDNFPFRKSISSLDVGLHAGLKGDEYLSILARHLEELKNRGPFDYVFYNAGVDVLETDALGKLMVNLEECGIRDEMVMRFCKEQHLPLTVTMGGGYSPNIGIIVDAHVQTFKTARTVFSELL